MRCIVFLLAPGILQKKLQFIECFLLLPLETVDSLKADLGPGPEPLAPSSWGLLLSHPLLWPHPTRGVLVLQRPFHGQAPGPDLPSVPTRPLVAPGPQTSRQHSRGVWGPLGHHTFQSLGQGRVLGRQRSAVT